jgi:UDP-hydrolysing UDP-N-acetyl-D-glucosamine 2-epimerase
MARTHTHHRVAIVTGTRAEFGLLEPVLQAIARRRRIESRLIVTGMHLLAKFGHTVREIRDKGYEIHATVRMQTGRDGTGGEAQAVARGIAGIARALDRLECQTVLVLGDRIEAFAGAAAGAVSRRAVAHIHGGDRAPGDIDEALRNAITRLAHVHFAASRDAVGRLVRMGEPADRVHFAGAPGLDAIRQFRSRESRSHRVASRRMAELIGPLAGSPYAVLIQHPCGRDADAEAAVMRQVIRAVERAGLPGVAIWPNSDPGHDGIIRELERLTGRCWRVFRSLVREEYLRLVQGSAVLVGNSSSGIIESASLGVNVVNIGPRQEGRLRCGRNVLDAGEDEAAILRAIHTALRRPRPDPGQSVYGDGRAGERIARGLEGLRPGPDLLRKALSF